MSPKPGTLTAVQVIFFIRAALGFVVAFLAFVGLTAMSEAEVQRTTGFGSGGLMFFLLIGVAVSVFELYVASTIGRGGHRTRTLVRVAAGLGIALVVLNMLTGESFLLGLVLMIVVLVLNESASAKDWYRETEYPTPRRGTV
ncbi:hypothetical protein ACFW31_02545 [Nocardiopsis alba]|uniref:hypothetical protein n=1 Tax=Nocardiopsis alba TaxID=53437 RepID=UPI00366F3DA4